MAAEFQGDACSTVRKRWMGKEPIMIPTIESVVGDSLRGKRVLEVGCGDGSLIHEYEHLGAREIVAIDANPEAIRNCEQEHYGEIEAKFECVSAMDMKYKAEFDVAMAIFVLQFNETQEELKKTLTNISKALKRNGILYGYVPNGVRNINPTQEEGEVLGATLILHHHPPRDGEPIKMRLYGVDDMKETPITFYYRETYERLLQNAGFDRIEWIPPSIEKKAEEEYGKEVCRSFLTPPKDIMFRAVKTRRSMRKR